jgi:hypothetical protein
LYLDLSVGLLGKLSLRQKSPGSVVLGHVNFDELDDPSVIELLVVEKRVELVPGRDLVELVLGRLSLLELGRQHRQDQTVVVGLDVVVLPVDPVDLLLDLVPVVVEHKHVRRQLLTHHGSDLLDGELEGSVADKEDGSTGAGEVGVLDGHEGAEGRADGPADGAPEDLGEGDGVLGEGDVEDAKDWGGSKR